MTGSAPTLYALPFVFAGLTVLAVGTAILLRERFSRVGWLHFLLSSTIGAWQLTTALEFLSADLEAATVWARVTTLFVLAIPPFSTSSPASSPGSGAGSDAASRVRGSRPILLLVVHLAGQMQAGIVAYGWGYYPLYAPAGWVFVFFTMAVVVLCMKMYWQQYREQPPRQLRVPAWAAAVLGPVRGLHRRDRFSAGAGHRHLPVRGAGRHGGQHRQRLHHLALSPGRDHPGLRGRPADGLDERRGGR